MKLDLGRIEDLARRRAEEAAAAGRDPRPWDDPERDFLVDVREELADALNYLTWSQMQRAADNQEIQATLQHAARLLRSAYYCVGRADALRAGDDHG